MFCQLLENNTSLVCSVCALPYLSEGVQFIPFRLQVLIARSRINLFAILCQQKVYVVGGGEGGCNTVVQVKQPRREMMHTVTVTSRLGFIEL